MKIVLKTAAAALAVFVGGAAIANAVTPAPDSTDAVLFCSKTLADECLNAPQTTAHKANQVAFAKHNSRSRAEQSKR
jgi:hypothetical protein